MSKFKFLKIGLLIGIILFTACKKDETEPDPEPTPATPNYTNFKILQVKITAMPFLDGSNVSWDLLNGPDVFFNMEDVNNTVLYNGSSSKINDISTTDLPLAWNFINAYQITNLTVTHYVTVYDYDTPDPNDLIGYVGFTMNEHKTGYPKSITKTSGNVTVVITGEWY